MTARRKPSISDAAVKKATGKGWSQWFRILDAWGARKKSHAEVARHLHDKLGVRPWWSQMVTVQYERRRGQRVAGQSSTKGFQVSVSRTVSAAPSRVWKLVVGGRWLGLKKASRLGAGRELTLRDGTRVTVRGVRARKTLRLTWRARGQHPSTVEVRLSVRDGRTSGVLDHHGLVAKGTAERMRKRWRSAAAKLAP